MSSHIEENVIDKLRRSKYPIFIWGAGSMSLEIERCMIENDISICGKFVNQDISKVHIVDTDKKVYTIAELEARYDKINVIIGHGHYEKRNDLKAYSFIEDIYIIPNPYSQYCGPNEDYVRNNADKIQIAKKCLSDEISMNALESYIEFGLSGDIECLLKSRICNGNMFHFDELCIKDDECFVDVGAWEGDTITEYLKKTNNAYKAIYAFEPEPSSFEILAKQHADKQGVYLYQCGLGLQSGFFYMENKNTQSSHIVSNSGSDNGLIKIEVKTLDEIFVTEQINILKVFVPFMFLDILKGGESTIKRNRPRLIVNVAADNKSDVFDTIIWINSLGLDYKIALRYDFPMPTRLCLYAY